LIGFTSLPRAVRARIYYFIIWTNIREFLAGGSLADNFFEAFMNASPVRHNLEMEAMTTKILGITYDSSWRPRTAEHAHPTSLLLERRLTDPILIGNISNLNLDLGSQLQVILI
jgi:hypothetical protein